MSASRNSTLVRPACSTRSLAAAIDSAEIINRRETGIRALTGKRDRLAADATSTLEHRAPSRVCGIGMQKLDQRRRLIVKTLALARGYTVDVDVADIVSDDSRAAAAVCERNAAGPPVDRVRATRTDSAAVATDEDRARPVDPNGRLQLPADVSVAPRDLPAPLRLGRAVSDDEKPAVVIVGAGASAQADARAATLTTTTRSGAASADCAAAWSASRSGHAVGDRRQRLIDPQIRIEQLHLDRLAVGERDDRADMDLVARIRVRSFTDRDRYQFAALS